MARLILEHNSEVVKDYTLAKKSLTIGRHVDNNVVLDDPGVSGFHARIDKTGSDYILTDLQSTNGTLLNEENIVSHRLSHGDKIMIGDHTILFIGSEMAKAYEEGPGLDFNVTTVRGGTPKRRSRPKPRTIETKETAATERSPGIDPDIGRSHGNGERRGNAQRDQLAKPERGRAGMHRPARGRLSFPGPRGGSAPHRPHVHRDAADRVVGWCRTTCDLKRV